MILKFSLNLFEQEDKIDTVVEVILELLRGKFLWDIDNLDELFPLSDKNTFTMPFDKRYISEVERKKLNEKIEEIYKTSAYITKTHQHYLTTFTSTFGIEIKFSSQNLRLTANVFILKAV